MAYTVRPLAADDKPRWRELFDGYLVFYKTSLSEEQIELTFQRLMGDFEWDPKGLVAVNGDGRIDGITHYVFHRSTWSPTVYCYLEDLFADPAIRGSGAGRALIMAVYDAADAKGATRTYWATQEFNYPGRTLYDKVAEKSPFIQYRRAPKG
jgi:GNAT superfamily N-acetyltransferase